MIQLSHNAQWVLFSAMILGTAAGIIGSFAYWKRQSLMSDALSHAALPGVVAGFMAVGTKSLPAMIAGAALSALLGAWLINGIRSSTRVKEDAAMGIVLSVFFGLGIMMLTFANRMANGNQSGLDSFIFGQAASMVRQDVWIMAVLASLIILVAATGFKEWKLFLFDSGFGQGLGLSVKGMNMLYMSLLVLVIVIGIQAVGVILMSALLIIPPVSARYWTNSFGRMVLLSGTFGGGAGLVGTYISTLGKGWPTGPFIVIAAACLFLISLLFGGSKGLFITAINRNFQQKRLARPGMSSRLDKGAGR